MDNGRFSAAAAAAAGRMKSQECVGGVSTAPERARDGDGDGGVNSVRRVPLAPHSLSHSLRQLKTSLCAPFALAAARLCAFALFHIFIFLTSAYTVCIVLFVDSAALAGFVVGGRGNARASEGGLVGR